MLDAERVKAAAARCGFSLCGVTPAVPLEEQREHLERWLSSGRAAATGGYMAQNIDRRLDSRLLFEGARSVIVCAVNYKNQAWNQSLDPLVPRVASYALARDYHVTIKQMLDRMLVLLKESYPTLRGRGFTDSAPLLEKELAIRAGLGWRGRNSLLITKEYGSFVLLGELVVDMQADVYDRPLEQASCGACRKCIESCPAGALDHAYTVDARLCIACRTMYASGGAPDNHGWKFGCDECQQCCPHNQSSPMHIDSRFDTIVDYRTLTSEFWDNLTDDTFDKVLGETPMAFFRR